MDQRSPNPFDAEKISETPSGPQLGVGPANFCNLVRLTAGAGGPRLGGNLREGVHEKYAENYAAGCHQLFVYDRGRVIASGGAEAEEACRPGATTDAGTVAGHARREAVAQHCAAPAQSGRLGSGAPAQRSGTPLRAYPLAVQQEPASAG